LKRSRHQEGPILIRENAKWWIYALAWAPTPITMTAPFVWTLVRFSCPVVMVGIYLHLGVSLFWVLVANAATYALIGLLIERLHRPTASAT
jgi:hypothetical protein